MSGKVNEIVDVVHRSVIWGISRLCAWNWKSLWRLHRSPPHTHFGFV